MDLLGGIEKLWLAQIERARKHKNRVFDETARRAWQYYGDGNHLNVLYLENASKTDAGYVAMPDFPVTCNLTAEFVRMMLPYVHNRVPVRLVTPRRPPMPPILSQFFPNTQEVPDLIRSHLMKWVLNYTPDTFDLDAQGRLATTEALVKGRGLVWHEMHRGLVGSFAESVDYLLTDPDAEQFRNCAFIVRERLTPVWQKAQEYSLDVEKLQKCSGEVYSQKQSARIDSIADGTTQGTRDKLGHGDLVLTYQIYSRMGIGHRFVGAESTMKDLTAVFDAMGDHIFLEICPGYGSPLNLPQEVLSQATTEAEIKARLSWPIAFYGSEMEPWPCTPLDFYVHPRRSWPSSPLEPALPLQAKIDYYYSYVMGRVRRTCRDIIIANKAIGEALKEALRSGPDQSVVMTDLDVQEIQNLIHILQFPPVNKDIYEAIRLSSDAFRQSTGLVELMYGAASRAMRSAEEASNMQSNMSIRPEDMADQVENWHARIAAKEAAATRMHVGPEMFVRMASPQQADGSPFPDQASMQMAQMWAALVNTQDPYDAASEMLYSVEAGTGRKRNLRKMMDDVNGLLQNFGQQAMQIYTTMGDPRIINEMIYLWGDAHQADTSKMMLPPAPPPPPPPPPGGPPQEGPPPEQGPPQQPPPQ